ncbi:MAG TPA: hypothetical protein VNO31_30070 [Umezawaea sp.]|jgi:hypothetical protein|nr:hypothetical protein [Umezawaea sp.]
MALIGFDAITAGGAVGAAIGSGLSGVGPAPTTTKMQVDLDEAPKLIEGLKVAIDQLQQAYDEAQTIVTAAPAANDPYSGNVSVAMGSVAGADQGGYCWANEGARAALLKTIENIEKSMAGYSDRDTAASDSMTTKE